MLMVENVCLQYHIRTRRFELKLRSLSGALTVVFTAVVSVHEIKVHSRMNILHAPRIYRITLKVWLGRA